MQTNLPSLSGRAATGQPPMDARTKTIPLGLLARAAVVTALVALVSVLIVYVAAGPLGVPGDYAPFFNPATILISVLVSVILATAGLAVLGRVTRRAGTYFRGAAVALTLLSLGGPVQALAGAMPGLAAATAATGAAMIAMHLITGGAIASLLPALARGGSARTGGSTKS